TAPGAALAAQTSAQVRAIIEAAEASAAGIREGATADARTHVARVVEAADALRERIDALERELTAMLGDVRGGADRLRRELDEAAEVEEEPALAAVVEAPAGDAAPERSTDQRRARLVAAGMAVDGTSREEI